ncbi:hypothetical protein ASF21_07690 [Arthrobacter sp. Leaf234]|uniref:hypothetical protein n=1 Tax=Arthrobacter sp. Leaf234 TaxID=1736303 RepID=UPI0007017E90|nr:hypothetical protein [Arthrobacter sp. Leaf234]KQO01507.1 hypothetical protein ASF21_07690 [Arthrobacter sp. Leaf234]
MREQAKATELDAREREAKASMAEAEAQRAEVEAQRLRQQAQERQADAHGLREKVTHHSQEADALDPDVPTDKDRRGH